MKGYYAQWKQFIKIIEKDDNIYIIESFLFQDVLYFPHFMNDLDLDVIKEHSHKLMNAAKHLDPLIVHLYQKDVNKSMRRNWQRRGDDWKSWVVKSDIESLYCKNRKLEGDEGSIQIWQDFTDFSVELFKEYDLRKVQIENLKQDWEKYREQILKFLELKKANENLYIDSFKRYYGQYLGGGTLFRLHENDNRLCLDAFWPNLKLIPRSKNEVEMEGFPISLRFYSYGGKRKMKFVKAGCYFKEKGIADEYVPFKSTEKYLSKFCGEWYCETEKLDRKIFLKDGKIYYYWCDVDSQCQLLPYEKNKFVKLVMSENMITFKKIKGSWQFSVWDKGHKSDAVFVKKKKSNKEKSK